MVFESSGAKDHVSGKDTVKKAELRWIDLTIRNVRSDECHIGANWLISRERIEYLGASDVNGVWIEFGSYNYVGQ